MEITQMFETTVISHQTQHAAHVMVVPAPASIGDANGTTISRTGIVKELQLVELVSISLTELPLGLTELLSQFGPPETIPGRLTGIRSRDVPYAQRERTTDQEFAERIAFASVIPIQQSPLKLDSLANLAAASGATLGFVLAGSSPLLLLVTIPGAIILVGAAEGVAAALKEGLRERLLVLIRGR